MNATSPCRTVKQESTQDYAGVVTGCGMIDVCVCSGGLYGANGANGAKNQEHQ